MASKYHREGTIDEEYITVSPSTPEAMLNCANLACNKYSERSHTKEKEIARPQYLIGEIILVLHLRGETAIVSNIIQSDWIQAQMQALTPCRTHQPSSSRAAFRG
jgi:hypothetical protein